MGNYATNGTYLNNSDPDADESQFPGYSTYSSTTVPPPAASGVSVMTLVLIVIPISIIIIVVVLGNALVIFAVLREERLKNKWQNWLIVSLSVADLLVGLLVMPLTLSYTTSGRWRLGNALCEIWLALDVLFVTASILNLCAISIDRYWSLTNPVYSATKRTRGRILTMIACIWTLAFVICLPPLVGWRPKDRQPGECKVSEDVGYVIYSSMGSFFLPLDMLLFIYVKIFRITRHRAIAQRRKVKQRQHMLLQTTGRRDADADARAPLCERRKKKRCAKLNELTLHKLSSSVNLASQQNLTTPGESPMVNRPNNEAALPANPQSIVVGNQGLNDKEAIPQKETAFASSAPSSPSALQQMQDSNKDIGSALLLKPLELQLRIMQHRKVVRRRERQATLLLGLILGAFTVSWLPFFTIYILGAVCCKTPELIFDVIFWLGYCNSGLNPFIYNFFNPDFRVAFHKILCRRK